MKSNEQPTLTSQQVLINPQNNSTSKFQFSFSKAQRFYSLKKTKVKTETDESYHFYDIPSTNNKKAPSFGIGEKSVVFNVKAEVPPATRYTPTLVDDFDHYAKKQNKKGKGFSFTVGRENVKSLSFIKRNQNPGPGNYHPNPEKMMNNSFYGYSMTKNQRFFDSKQKLQSSLDNVIVPRPGHYPVKSTLGGQNKILSQDKNNNPCLKLISSKNQSRRLQTQPDPKIYNPQLTRTGDSSTFYRKKGFTLGKSKRSNLVQNKDVPGPGNYRVFSQFASKSKGK